MQSTGSTSCDSLAQRLVMRNKTAYVLAAAIQKLVMKEMTQEMKMVPRRPKALLRGAFIQQPIRHEQR